MSSAPPVLLTWRGLVVFRDEASDNNDTNASSSSRSKTKSSPPSPARLTLIDERARVTQTEPWPTEEKQDPGREEEPKVSEVVGGALVLRPAAAAGPAAASAAGDAALGNGDCRLTGCGVRARLRVSSLKGSLRLRAALSGRGRLEGALERPESEEDRGGGREGTAFFRGLRVAVEAVDMLHHPVGGGGGGGDADDGRGREFEARLVAAGADSYLRSITEEGDEEEEEEEIVVKVEKDLNNNEEEEESQELDSADVPLPPESGSSSGRDSRSSSGGSGPTGSGDQRAATPTTPVTPTEVKVKEEAAIAEKKAKSPPRPQRRATPPQPQQDQEQVREIQKLQTLTFGFF